MKTDLFAGKRSPARLRRFWLERVKQWSFHIAALLVTVIFLLPLVWMFSASLRQPGLPPPRTIEWLPDPLAWQNYLRIFAILPFGRYFVNSLLVALAAVALTLLTASWAGFGMSQLDRQARRRLLVLSVGLLMIPVTALWLTRFLLIKWLGLYNSFAALILPSLMGSSPLFILLFYWAFRRLPAEIFESGRLDGAAPLAAWWYLAFPLVRPTAVAVGMLAFLLYWNDFINPLLYLNSQSLFTLPLGLRQLQQLDKTNWPLLMAGSVVMTLPAVLVFAFVQRFFLQDYSDKIVLK